MKQEANTPFATSTRLNPKRRRIGAANAFISTAPMLAANVVMPELNGS